MKLSSLAMMKQQEKLDFRFADEEDADDMEALVNEAYAIEKGDSGEAFRANDRITVAQINEEIDKGKDCWYLADDSYDQLVSCANFSFDGSIGHIKLLAVKKICQKEKIGARMLHRVETVLMGMGCSTVVISIPHHRTSLQKWCARQGYKENGGRIWPQELNDEITRTTMLLDFKKELHTGPRTTASTSGEVDEQLTSLSGQLQVSDACSSPSAQNAGDSLEDLVRDLHRAVRTEEGAAAYAELAQKENQSDIFDTTAQRMKVTETQNGSIVDIDIADLDVDTIDLVEMALGAARAFNDRETKLTEGSTSGLLGALTQGLQEGKDQSSSTLASEASQSEHCTEVKLEEDEDDLMKMLSTMTQSIKIAAPTTATATTSPPAMRNITESPTSLCGGPAPKVAVSVFGGGNVQITSEEGAGAWTRATDTAESEDAKTDKSLLYFVACHTNEGHRAGYEFRPGNQGVGYYLTAEDTRHFVAAPTFEGVKPGYVFQTGGRGVGYYSDSTEDPVKPVVCHSDTVVEVGGTCTMDGPDTPTGGQIAASTIYHRLFRSLPPDVCKQLSKTCREQEFEAEQPTTNNENKTVCGEVRGLTSSKTDTDSELNLVYGEIEFESFETILDIALKSYESGPQGRAGKQPKTFYDLGSGVGRPVFAAAVLHPFEYVAGVELLEGLHRLASHLLTYYNKLFVPVLPARWQGQRVELIRGNFLEEVDWMESDIVFAHCTCFSDKMMAAFSKRCESLKQGAIVITVSHILQSAMFKIVDERQLVMTWGTGTCYVHQRKSVGKWAATILGGAMPIATKALRDV